MSRQFVKVSEAEGGIHAFYIQDEPPEQEGGFIFHEVLPLLEVFPPWPPSPAHVLRWINSSLQWVDPSPLEDLKARKRSDINQWRAKANFTSFPFQGKLIACDQLSRSDIDGVANHIALLGVLPPDFPMAWKAMDNTYVPIPDVDAFKAMYSAMTAQGTANFEKSQQLKAQVNSAGSVSEVSAIVLPE